MTSLTDVDKAFADAIAELLGFKPHIIEVVGFNSYWILSDPPVNLKIDDDILTVTLPFSDPMNFTITNYTSKIDLGDPTNTVEIMSDKVLDLILKVRHEHNLDQRGS